MPYEVECGECHKQILIEDLGVEVSCPYCQTTLILTEEDLANQRDADLAGDSHVVISEEASFDFNYSEGSSSSVLANGESSDSQLGGSGVSSAIMDGEPPDADQQAEVAEDSAPDFTFLKTPGEDATLDSDEPETREEIPNYDFTGPSSPESEEAASSTESSDIDEDDVLNFNFGDPADVEVADLPAISIDTTTPSSGEIGSQAESDQKAKAKSRKKAGAEEDSKPIAGSVYARRTRNYPPRVVHFLISYSILVTLAFLYLLVSFFSAKPHQLESLPDIAPPEEGQFRHIRENAVLAPGHTLEFGETQRFGNIRVTPLKVTRAPLQFVYFQKDGLGGSIPPTRPVLKLWLKIENVSSDQVFPPLDLKMLTIREHDTEEFDLIHANNWVCRTSDLNKRTNRILMYNHPETSVYDIKGFVTRPLKPGETVETFLPTQEDDLGKLTGPLVWRFQIRKGFNPDTMNGVSTLVEVEFSSDDVQKEST